ncbi:conserved exported protein of unknown function [Magnetospirillum sp. XM-1]|uniref:hypothetical protein n=1 Tax=Magnetospirillum sp. XM-1 TaxID=1663591 RepID=UPI00073DFF86|nr:hypothetical protein [Magnetospirillum sp. XM-1]CUW37158.1 conserved exported protein of unknown function [Magnetospirillum sp. XM-1]
MTIKTHPISLAVIAITVATICPVFGGDAAKGTDSDHAKAVAQIGCASLAARVDNAEGRFGPLFLRSFDGPTGSGPPDNVALSTAAMTYDNALTAIALIACGRLPQAKRVGEALALAASSDRAGNNGRIRNAYRAGPQEKPPLPNGWWDAKSGRWLEDAYQVGTSTGNVAWAALALLTLADATGDRQFLTAASRLAVWATTETSDLRGVGGFTGGIFDGEGNPRLLTWKSTEHNADLEAVFQWLARTGAPGQWRHEAGKARKFTLSQWDEKEGKFITGTLPDGISLNRKTSGLDAQLWPQLLPDAPVEWRRSLIYAEAAHGVPGGFSFNNDRGGFWSEGTAQAALIYRLLGQADKAEQIFSKLEGLFATGGYIWATPQERHTTGLAIGPDSISADFYYYRLPHLGATAWAVIAATGWNPYVGKKLKSNP